jgi:hypothetical protein
VMEERVSHGVLTPGEAADALMKDFMKDWLQGEMQWSLTNNPAPADAVQTTSM